MATLDRETLKNLGVFIFDDPENPGKLIIQYESETFVCDSPLDQPDRRTENLAVFIAKSHEEVLDSIPRRFKFYDLIARSEKNDKSLGILFINQSLPDYKYAEILMRGVFGEAEDQTSSYIGETSIVAAVTPIQYYYNEEGLEPRLLSSHNPGEVRLKVCQLGGFKEKRYGPGDLARTYGNRSVGLGR